MIKQIFLAIAACCFVYTIQCNNSHYKEYNHSRLTKQENGQPGDKNLIKQPTITIWVHGTRNSRRILWNRYKTIQGMHHASVYSKENNLLWVAQYLEESDPKQFPFENTYMFGWQGDLGVEIRKDAARQLYDALLELIKEIQQKKGTTPLLRLITHSHGGNVCLHLAEIAQEKEVTLEIEELVLLACPVQRRTSCYMQDPMFKTICHFYSPIDLTQVADPQILQGPLSDMEGPVFSERTFPDQENLIQLDIGPIMHITFFKRKFLKRLGQLLDLSRAKLREQLFEGALNEEPIF